MNNKLVCPFCQTELEQMHDKKMFGCSKCLHIADGAFWKKTIQAKQDLETAKADIEDYKKYKALWEQIRNNTILELERKLKIAKSTLEYLGYEFPPAYPEKNVIAEMRQKARDAVKYIEHKE